MSMKSMTTMPPMSRSRSWRTISSAASRLFLVTVCSRFPPDPVNLPVLTSTTVIASVRSITKVPPDGSHTLRSSALVSCSSMRRNGVDVVVDRLPCVVAGHDQPGEVLVEQVADHLDENVGLFVERDRGACGLLLGLLRLGFD